MSNKTESPTAPLLTIPDVAAICRVSTKTVRRWIKATKLAAFRVGIQWRIAPKDLNLFLRERWSG